MLTILLHGANGAMGRELRRLLETGFADCAAGPMVSRSGNGVFASFSEVREPVDVVLDFSFHAATESALSFALEHDLPIVIGTTGHTDVERKLIEKASEEDEYEENTMPTARNMCACGAVRMWNANFCSTATRQFVNRAAIWLYCAV